MKNTKKKKLSSKEMNREILRRILNTMLCILLSLLIGFIATYSLFYFSVDSYKYSSDKKEKSFFEIGYKGFDINASDSMLRSGRQSDLTDVEKRQIFDCLNNAKYVELPLIKAFPLFYIAFTPKHYICEMYNDLSIASNINELVQGTVFLFNNSVYIYNYTGEDIESTVYKAVNINTKIIQKIGGVEITDLKYVGTEYQYLYNDAIYHDWYFYYKAIFVAKSFVAFILLNLVKYIRKKFKCVKKSYS